MTPASRSLHNHLPPSAILFDWDNTLVDSWQTVFNAFNQTLIQFGMAPWDEEYAKANIQRSGREAFPKLFGARAREAQKTFYKQVEEVNLKSLNPLPEAESLLRLVIDKQIPMGVVSNKSAPMLAQEVSYLGWDRYFRVVVGAGDAPRDKPAADPLLFALESLSISASTHVWMVGDTPVDWECALAAGCQPIAIGNRFEAPPSVLVSIENCGALKKIFAEM